MAQEGSPGTPARDASNLTISLTIGHVRARAGTGGVERLLELAGETRPLAVLEDQTGWSTQEQKIRLFEAAAVVLDDPQAARRVGETVLEQRTATSLKLLLRTLGSPAALYRSVARASAKFSTNYTCTALSVGRREAVISNRIHEGYTPHTADCAYTAGLLATVPAVFGLPLATVAHDECQVLGAPACVYRMRWRTRSRLPWRAARAREASLAEQLRTVTERHESLQSTLADLVSPADVDTVLRRITRRAADAVHASQFLLALSGEDGESMLRYEGMTGEEAAALAERVLHADSGALGPSVLCADVVSARRRYGRLVALGAGHSFFPEEERLLATYAKQAAVALDAATALDEVRERGDTAQRLLDLARSLGVAQTMSAVAQTLAAAVPAVIGGHRCAVMLWDDKTQQLATVGMSHRPEGRAPARFGLDSPAIRSFVQNMTFQRMTKGSDDPFIRQLMTERGLEEALCVPVGSDGAFLGVIITSRRADDPPFVDERALADRLVGLADHAALAFSKVRLLEQERRAVERLRREEAWNKHLAYHDALTGLPNARSFSAGLDETLGGDDPGGVAVLFCDLDRFKNVNDSLGHARGDELLCQAADRLRSRLGKGMLARLGGDEFAVLVSGVDDAAAVGEDTARRLIDVLSEPFEVGGQVVFVTASIGMAVSPIDGDEGSVLLMNADAAMYAAKAAGRNAYRRYDPEMNAGSRQQLALEADLHDAIGNGGLVVYYQTEVDARSGEIRRLEALVRWMHPGRGLLAPPQFLPMAEETGLIAAVDEWVIRAVCAQAQAWDDAGLVALPIAVNVSVPLLERSDLPDLLAAVLAAHGLPASRLEIELTEHAAMREATDNVRRIRELGISVALDDFGTGYSLPGYLKRYVADRVKIDRSFVTGLPGDRYDRAVVEAMIRMAHDLGIAVTAEGVETAEQAEYLAAQGCDLLQGYLFARPARAEDLAARLPARGKVIPAR